MNARINDVSLNWDDTGQGPAVLLIHGFPLCRRMWAPQVAALAGAGYRVVAPDLRGFGDSGPGGRPGDMDLLADDLVGLLDHLQIEQAAVCGMSMGGYVLLNLLARHRSRVGAACFLVTRADADDETARGKRDHLIAEVRAGRPQAVAQAFSQVLFAPDTPVSRPDLAAEVNHWMETTDPAGLVFGLAAIRDRIDSRALLPDLDLPALVIGAAEDRAIAPEQAEKIAAAIPGAGLHLVPGAGHMANLEEPEAVNAALLEFLAAL